MLLKKSFIAIVRRFSWVNYSKQPSTYLLVFLSMFLMPSVIQAVNSPPHHKSEKTIKVKDTLTKGQEQWKKGELEKALLTLEEAVKLDPSNKQIANVFKSMQLQKKRIDGLLEKVSDFIDKNNYQDAKKSLQKASYVNDKYLGYQKVFQQFIDDEKRNIGKEDLKKMAKLMVASTRFKEMAANDYAKALLTLSKDKGMEQLHVIDKTLWDVKICQIGWKLFFDSAIRIYNKEFDKYPLIGYYNPFSDIYLITVWTQDNEGYIIVDAEMLMGDFVRGSSNEFDNTPFWLRDKKHRTANLGISIALSTLAFEEVFEKATRENWRNKLKVLNYPTALHEFNYPNIAISLNYHLLNIANFSSPKDDNPQLQECHRMTIDLLKSAKNGTIDTMLAIADKTPIQTAKILKNISVKWVEDLTVAAVINDKGECLVLLTPMKQSSGSISFLFKERKNQLQLERIDLIDYQQFYDVIKTFQEKKQKGVL